MNKSELKSGVVLSYITQGVHLLISLLYTPVMLNILGQSEYGLYQLVSSVVSYLGLLNFGFNAGYVRFYSRYKANDDEDKISVLNGMFFLTFAVIALVCILCGSVMVINIKRVFGDGLTSAELNKARVLMIILVFNMAASFISSVFDCNIAAHERFFFPRLLNLIKTIATPFLMLPILIMGYGSVGMVLVSVVLSLSVIIANICYSFKKLKIKFNFNTFDWSLFKEMFSFTFFIFIGLIVDQINWNVDKFLIGRMLGTAQVSVYSIAAQLNNLYMTFSCVVSGVFVPKINFLVSKTNDNAELTKLFTKVGRIQFVIVTLILSGFILFGNVFIKLWVGDEYSLSYIMAVLLMAPATIPFIQNLGIEIQRAKNMHQFRSYLYLGMAFLNIAISIFFINLYGTVGATFGTAISLLVCNGLIINIYYHKKIGLDVIYFWKEIIKFVPSVLISVLSGLLIKVFILDENFINFVISIVFYSIIYFLSMWFVGLNREEKSLVSVPLKRIGEKYAKNS